MTYVRPMARLLRALVASAIVTLMLCPESGAEPSADKKLVRALESDLSPILTARRNRTHLVASLSISFPKSQTNIVDTVGKWLPEYPRYAKIQVRRLLNMTSGIQTYDDTPAWMRAYVEAPKARMTPAELVAFVNGYPFLSGWNYSNTNYVLGQLIIEKITQRTYASEIERRFFKPLRMDATYYNGDVAPLPVRRRMMAGYFFSHDAANAGLKPLLGRDVRSLSLSWAQGAGAIISTPADLTRWVRGLFEGPVLASKQRSELLSLVANDTGLQVKAASAAHPHAFGLGVGQAYKSSVGGLVWYYEGETLGYRMLYGLFPRSNVVIAVGLNSRPNAKDDTIGALLESVFETLHAAHRT